MIRGTFIFLFCFISMTSMCQRMTPQEYVDKYKGIAISEMRRSGVPAAITLAQGILETESGNSDLLKRSNNHFGIKCKSNWNGPSVSHDDDAKGECFRAYESAEDSYRDHSDFLRNSSRYAFLFDLDPTDYKDWAFGLRKAGYATNPKYAYTLIDYIEKYDLEQYSLAGMINGLDSNRDIVKESMEPRNVVPMMNDKLPVNDWVEFYINKSKAIHAAAGTSLLAIATKFNVKLSRLLEYNDLEKDGILEKPQIIFLTKKQTMGEKPIYQTTNDEAIYDIAQENGIQLSALCQYNLMGKNEMVPAGTKIYLQPGQKESVSKTGTEEGNTSFHVVEPKEGLFGISKKYGVSVSQLKEWNHLPGDDLQIGQKLVIHK